MPLYKLFCISPHYPEYRHIKDLVQSSAKFLLDQGSPVREIRYLGMRDLPQKMRRHKHTHTVGDYWIMNFDASPTVLKQLNERMRTDHRVVRWTMLKLGEKLTDIASTQQATIDYDSDHLTGLDGGIWSTTQSRAIPSQFQGGVSTSGLLSGSGLQGRVGGVEGRVAGLNLDSERVAGFGGKGYARERIP